MRFPKLPARKDAPEHEEQHPQAEPSAAAGGPSAGYGDVAMPDLPPPPLTSELTRSIRFTISEPQGYFFEQVESFVQQVVEALHYYEQAEFAWRQAAYEMQIEMDQQAYDLQRVRSEIELFKVQGSPLVNADGTYVTESQQAETEALVSDLAQAQAALTGMQAAIVERDAEVERLQGVAASQDQDIVSLRTWGDQMSAEFASMQEQLAAALAENDALRADQSTNEGDAPVSVEKTPDVPVAPVAPLPVHDNSDASYAEPVADEPDTAVGTADVDVPVVHIPTVSLPASDVADFDATDEADEEGYETDEDYDDADEEEDASGTAVDAAPVDPSVYYTDEQPEPVASGTDADAVALDEEDPEDVVESDYAAEGEHVGEYTDHEASRVDDDSVAYGTDDMYDGEEPGESVAVVPVDSELPDGAILPGTGENAITYPPAAPGIPLDTRGVPVEVWAPELDARFQEGEATDHDAAQDPEPVDGTEPEPVEVDSHDEGAASDDEDAYAPEVADGIADAPETEVAEPTDATEFYDPEASHEAEDDDAVDDDADAEAAEGHLVDDVDYASEDADREHNTDGEQADPYAEYDEDDEYGESVAVVPVDSELPEGAMLPGTGENAITYPPTAPGIPLDTRGVPVEVWAPELNPRLRAALEADKQEHDAEHSDEDAHSEQ